MDIHRSLPSGSSHENPTGIDNHTIPEETPQIDQEPNWDLPVVISSHAVVAPAPNLPSVSNVSAGESSIKKKSKKFRKVPSTREDQNLGPSVPTGSMSQVGTVGGVPSK